MELVAKCPICKSNIDLNPDVENKNGLSIPLQLNFISCKFDETFYSCESEEKKKVGQAGFDINKRIIKSFREIGKGYSALEDFCGVMDMQKLHIINIFHPSMKHM